MQNRIVYLDVVKTFAIFTVVLGHVCLNFAVNVESVVHQYCIMPYHMALFTILSGFFFRWNVPFMDFLRNKVTSILFPYIVWCSIYYVIFNFIGGVYRYIIFNEPLHLMGLVNCFFKGIFEWGWWFLRALFFVMIYAYCSLRILKGHIVVTTLFSVILLWFCSFMGIIPNKSPMLIGFIFLYPFFASAIILKHYWDFVERNSRRIFWSCLLLYIFLFSFWGGYVDTFYDMNTSALEQQGALGITGWMVVLKTIYRWIIGLTASIVIVLFFRRLSYSSKFIKIIQPIALNTLGIYILQIFMFDLFERQIVFDNVYLSFLFALFVTLLVISICYLVIYVTSKKCILRLILWGKMSKLVSCK